MAAGRTPAPKTQRKTRFKPNSMPVCSSQQFRSLPIVMRRGGTYKILTNYGTHGY